MTFLGKTEDDTLKTSRGEYCKASMTLALFTFQITASETIPLHNLIKEPRMEGPLGYRAFYIILYSLVLSPKASCPQLNVAT